MKNTDLVSLKKSHYESAKKQLNKINKEYIKEVNSTITGLVGKKVSIRTFDVSSDVMSMFSLDNILDSCLTDYEILADE